MSSVLPKYTSLYFRALRNAYKCQFPGPTNIGFNRSYTLSQKIISSRCISSSKGSCCRIENELLCVRPRNNPFHGFITMSTQSMSSYRNRGNNQEDDLPVLSELPRRIFPNFTHYLRSLFFTHVIITPFFDNDFSKDNFMDGATKAVEVVSSALSQGDFDSLESLLEKKCLDDIKRKLSFSTATQRDQLKVKAENIYSQFLYEIGIMFDDGEEDEQKQKRWVEITYIAHTHPSFSDKFVEETSLFQRGTAERIRSEVDSQGGPVVLNYRFLREFTKGVDPSTTQWTISSINHFRMLEEESLRN